MLLLPISDACDEAHATGIAYPDMPASIDSPEHINLAFCIDSSSMSSKRTAAPPAIVPNRQLLISMTFFTVWLAIQFPAVARESVATIMPP